MGTTGRTETFPHASPTFLHRGRQPDGADGLSLETRGHGRRSQPRRTAQPGLAAEEARIAAPFCPCRRPRAELLRPGSAPITGFPPWTRSRPPSCAPPLIEGIDLQRAEINAIADNPEPPTFTTPGAYQMPASAGRASSIYGVMTQNIGSDDYQAWTPRCAPSVGGRRRDHLKRKAFGRIKDRRRQRRALG